MTDNATSLEQAIGKIKAAGIPVGVEAEEGPVEITNACMAAMIAQLAPYLERTDVIGYAAARNTRILRDCAAEYISRVDALVEECGVPEIGEDGQPTGRLMVAADSPRYAEVRDRVQEWGAISHSPALYLIPYGEAVGRISGAQLLELDWMFEE